MSIFETSFLDVYENEQEFRNEIIDYFKSNNSLFNITSFDGFMSRGAVLDCVHIFEIVKVFFEYFKLPISLEDVNKLSIYDLIEIFLNIDLNLGKLIKMYQEKRQQQKNEYIDGKLLGVDKILKNKVVSFIENKNIKLKKIQENKVVLDLSSLQLIKDINHKPTNKLLEKYCHIKNSIKDDINLEEKKNILSALKNNLDKYFKNGFNYKNSFLEIHHNKLRSFWQIKGSHDGSESKQENIKVEKEKFEKLTLDEKHKKINDCIDAIIYLVYINKL